MEKSDVDRFCERIDRCNARLGTTDLAVKLHTMVIRYYDRGSPLLKRDLTDMVVALEGVTSITLAGIPACALG